MSKRKICIVTGTRAEYGLLYWLMKEIQIDTELELQIIVTGMHLSPDHGLTYQIIEQDGYVINEKVEMLLASDTPVGITKSIGLATIGFADALNRLRPDIMVVLGDRYEILAAVQAALVAKIPVAHIHGGETTEGAIDEAIRHSITKMSQIHFVAADVYRNRVIQLGEHPSRVYCFGAPGIENINKLSLLRKEELEAELGISFDRPTFLVTYHPVTLSNEPTEQGMESLLLSLERFTDSNIIFTMPNSDTNGKIIAQMVHNFVKRHNERSKVFVSLGQMRYLSTIKYCDVVIGNSSSGIIEAPFFKKPTVNIGDRQKGRLKASSVIDTVEIEEEITKSIKYALSPAFQEKLKSTASLYGTGNVSRKMKETLKTVKLDNILMKTFYDNTNT
ncbi:UDP-N-acetylglucosamine 2-epimerase [Brevibacillus sp. SYSU BS000544]|uniref:UDP-N-acetylglucosamine 2-epimerase n=1 Tax=Brevibacillus sp. SYSU BS000544 TaxID=3416443 RepID=UPI003CE57387